MNKSSLELLFSSYFDLLPEIIVRSPGRINLLGEHTDYNQGFVLPAAIDKAVYACFSRRADSEIILVAHDFRETYRSNMARIRRSEELTWPNYILGVVDQFTKLNRGMNGFNAVIASDLPIGAGLSSSAAVECGVAYALNRLYGFQISRLELVSMAQHAEHSFAGVMCGVMDQYASMFGRQDQVIRLDCRSVTSRYIPVDPETISLFLFDSQVKHSLASSEYNIRRTQCEEAVSILRKQHPEVNSLRDATIEMLENCLLPKHKLLYKRAHFVVSENLRVIKMCEYLEQNDSSAAGNLMYETHRGLKDDYMVSCAELDWLVEQSARNDQVLGARMMGGGFGGCTINLFRKGSHEEYFQTLKSNYYNTMEKSLHIYPVRLQDGTSEL